MLNPFTAKIFRKAGPLMIHMTEETANLVAEAHPGVIRGLVAKLGTNLLAFLAWLANSPKAQADLGALIAVSARHDWVAAVAAEQVLVADWQATHA